MEYIFTVAEEYDASERTKQKRTGKVIGHRISENKREHEKEVKKAKVSLFY